MKLSVSDNAQVGQERLSALARVLVMAFAVAIGCLVGDWLTSAQLPSEQRRFERVAIRP